jgi:hypothetical protein
VVFYTTRKHLSYTITRESGLSAAGASRRTKRVARIIETCSYCPYCNVVPLTPSSCSCAAQRTKQSHHSLPVDLESSPQFITV